MTTKLTQSPTVQPVISGDFRSPAVEPVPSGFDPLAMLADFRAFCAETPSVADPITDDTLTYWPTGAEETVERWGNLCVQDRKLVAWNDQRQQYVGEWPY